MEDARTHDNPGTSATPTLAPTTCRAIIQEGPRKGATCRFPPSADNAYCGRHQRNRVYDEGLTAGKIWCRFFFRGCDNTTTKSGTACDSCKAAKAPATAIPCAHEGCKNRAKEGTYCGKHKRDELLTSGIAYCDVARGCLNICESGRSSCAACLEKQRIKDNKRYAERKSLHTTIAAATVKTGTSVQICCHCGKDFEPFKTAHGKQSLTCPACRVNQQKQDAKRSNRGRNFKQEKAKNIDMHLKQYFTNAVKRGLIFELTVEQFTELVWAPCHYCDYKKSDEVNGIDRYDNSKGYTKENCRPCCEECNRIKYTFPAEFIIDRAHVISKIAEVEPFLSKWAKYYTREVPARLSHYKASAKKRGIKFELTDDQFNILARESCYLCRFAGPNGVDRHNSEDGYTLMNCSACCASCNISKGDISLKVFYEKNIAIAKKYPQSPLPLLPVALSSEERKHWKAATLYSALLEGRQHEYIADQPPGTVFAEELIPLHAAATTQPRESAIAQLKRFLATVSKRKKRAAAAKADTIQHVA